MSATLVRENGFNPINGHERYCQCGECEALIINQFSAFEIAPYAAKRNQIKKTCPECQKSTIGHNRGGFVIWSCWECSAKLGSVIKVINGSIPEKQYAFAEKEDGTQVYLHLNRYVDLTFDGSDYPAMSDFLDDGPAPDVDDVIMYQEVVGMKGPKALWWTFRDEYDEIKERIKHRPLFKFVRRAGKEVISSLSPDTAAVPNYQKLWEGRDLNDLKKKFPLQSWECRGSHDDHIAYYFMYHDVTADGWTLCADPRIPLLSKKDS